VERPVGVLGVVLVQAPVEDGEDVPDLARERRAREEGLVFEPMEMAPKAVERTNTASDALFSVCVFVDTLLSQGCPGRALSRL
jgi:hypothetical protein